MKPVKIHEFDPEIYPLKLWIAITEKGEPLAERFKDATTGKELNIGFISKHEAVTFYVQQKERPTYWGVLIVFAQRRYCSTKTICHEATHAARFMWDHIHETSTGEEADAYLVGWIANCIEIAKNFKNGKATDVIR
jgi:hypothetical protein